MNDYTFKLIIININTTFELTLILKLLENTFFWLPVQCMHQYIELRNFQKI